MTNLTPNHAPSPLRRRLAALENRRAVAKADLSAALKRPAADDQEVRALKRLKLRLKDEIAALRQDLDRA